MQLRVASYNIHRAIGKDGQYQPERILRVLSEIHADIVALQEIDLLEPGRMQLLPWLAARINMLGIAGPVRSRGTCEYGNALLTRFPVTGVRRLDLSVGFHEPRDALAVDLQVEGRTMHVVTTHLGLWPSERPVQAERLRKLLAPNRHELTILMGDLNEWNARGKALRSLGRLFGAACAPATFPARCPILALDRIWIAPAQAMVRVDVHDTPLSRLSSDHLPIKADIRFPHGPVPTTRLPVA
ncbi:MAG: endonuclease/exonuclease/phosphatase family protein [Nitrospira sp.]|nr:endonuclease/exonuclease/phosphatase family protein [Nitrospira sp.]